MPLSTNARLIACIVALASLVGCQSTEQRFLPEALTKLRLGMTLDAVKAVREGKLKEEKCIEPLWPGEDLCFKESEPVEGWDVFHRFRASKLAAIRLSRVDLDPATSPIASEARSWEAKLGLGEAKYRVKRVGRGLKAEADWSKGDAAVRGAWFVLEGTNLGVAEGESRSSLAVSVNMELSNVQALGKGEGEATTFAEVARAVEEHQQELKARAKLVGEIGARQVSSTTCSSALALAKVATPLCEALADAIRTGKTTEASRSRLREAIVAKGYRWFDGFVVGQVGEGEYEVARVRYGRFGTKQPFGDHLILKTTDTGFTSQGLFGLWVKTLGTQTIETTNGFKQQWEVIEESKIGTAVGAMFRAAPGAPTSEAASELLLSLIQIVGEG